MAGIPWGNPKITVEQVPDPNSVNSTNEHRKKNESVVLEVLDIFMITGRGTVVTGIVQNRIKLNEQIRIINPDNTIVYSEIEGIAMFGKLFDEAIRGDDVGLLLKGVRKSDVQIGAIIEKKTYSKGVDYFANNGSRIAVTKVPNPNQNAKGQKAGLELPAQSINKNTIESPTNNNVFVIEKKVPLKQDIFALIGRIEGNLTIRPNTKMQINTFLGEKLCVNILGVKWDGRMRQEISGGSDIMVSVSGISIDSVDIGDELMF